VQRTIQQLSKKKDAMETWRLKAWFNLTGVGRGKELLGLLSEWWGLKGLWLGWWAMEYLAAGVV
jgi:hypothetical protein